MQFKFDMIETRTYSVIYTVEAETAEEAYQKATRGDTIAEDGATLEDVIDRTVFEEIKEEEG